MKFSFNKNEVGEAMTAHLAGQLSDHALAKVGGHSPAMNVEMSASGDFLGITLAFDLDEDPHKEVVLPPQPKSSGDTVVTNVE